MKIEGAVSDAFTQTQKMEFKSVYNIQESLNVPRQLLTTNTNTYNDIFLFALFTTFVLRAFVKGRTRERLPF